MTTNLDTLFTRYKSSGSSWESLWEPPDPRPLPSFGILPGYAPNRPGPVGGSSARKPGTHWGTPQKAAERCKIVCKGVKELSKEQLASLHALTLYEQMLRNRLETVAHDSEGELVSVDNEQRHEMRVWLCDNATGFWHEDSEESLHLTFWFEREADMVAFSLRFSGE